MGLARQTLRNRTIRWGSASVEPGLFTTEDAVVVHSQTVKEQMHDGGTEQAVISVTARHGVQRGNTFDLLGW